MAITRPEPGTLAERLTARGAVVVHVPLIAVRPPRDPGALQRALAALGDFDWLVVTSANGARAAGPAAARHPAVRLAAVGPATAAALATASGRPVDLVPADARAAALAAAFPSPTGRVLLAQADRASGDLASALQARGAQVEVVEAYRTMLRVPTAGELASLAAADVIVLASGSAAEALVAVQRPASDTAIVAIGPSTAEVARRVGLRPSVSATPADDDVVAAVARSVR